MSYHPALGRWMETDPQPYGDGANLYEFVRSRPVTRTDPTGLISIDPSAPEEAREAFKLLEGNPIGQTLLIEIRSLEAKTRNIVIIYGPIRGISGSRSQNQVVNGQIRVNMDPRDAVGVDAQGKIIMSKATGDERCDVLLGIPLDEVMFHELTHAKHVLAGTDDWTSPDDQEFTDRWRSWEEYYTVQDENRYNQSRGYPLRRRYVNTEDQNAELERMALKTGLYPQMKGSANQ